MRALLAVVLLSVPAAAKPKPRPAPSLSGTGIYTSTAAIPPDPYASLLSSAVPAVSSTSPLSLALMSAKLLCFHPMRAEMMMLYPATPEGLSENVRLTADSLPGYAEEERSIRRCPLDDEATEMIAAGARRFRKRRDDLLVDLAALQQIADAAPAPDAWPDRLSWTVKAKSRTKLGSRRPFAGDFERRKKDAAEPPEHERPGTEPALKTGDLEFKP